MDRFLEPKRRFLRTLLRANPVGANPLWTDARTEVLVVEYIKQWKEQQGRQQVMHEIEQASRTEAAYLQKSKACL